MKCKECKSKFKPNREWQEYCSRKCGNRARYKRRHKRVKDALAKISRNKG